MKFVLLVGNAKKLCNVPECVCCDWVYEWWYSGKSLWGTGVCTEPIPLVLHKNFYDVLGGKSSGTGQSGWQFTWNS